MNSKEKFISLVSDEHTNTLGRIQERIAQRDSRRMAFDIALGILDRLDQLGWSQKRLAEELGVSPQLVNKWVRGKENFTIETLVKIGKTLNTSFIEVPLSIIEKSVSPVSFRSKPNMDSGLSETLYSLKKKLNFNIPDTHRSYIYFDTLNVAAEPTQGYASKVTNAIAPGTLDYLLSSVTVDQIEVHEAASSTEKEFDINIEIGYALQKEQHAIACALTYEMITADIPLLKFKVICLYTITSSTWDTIIKNSLFTIPSSFVRHLGVVTSGIAMGALHAKLENSIYKTYPMVLVNMDDLPLEDITFKVN